MCPEFKSEKVLNYPGVNGAKIKLMIIGFEKLENEFYLFGNNGHTLRWKFPLVKRKINIYLNISMSKCFTAG